MQRLNLKAVTLSLCILSAPLLGHSQSKRGTNSSGGGSNLKSEFKIKARALIQRIATIPEANDLCPASTLMDALDRANLLIVDELIDRDTGRPPAGDDLEAWVHNDEIQLLKSAWEHRLSSENESTGMIRVDTRRQSRSTEVTMIHELYRVTGVCEDNNYERSSKIPFLLRLPGINSQVFRLETYNTFMNPTFFRKHFVVRSKDGRGSNRFATLACATALPSQGENQCAGIDIQSHKLVVFETRSHLGRTSNQQPFGPSAVLLESRALSESEKTMMVNFMRFASKERPFLIVYDMNSGALSFGADLTQMKKINMNSEVPSM